VDPAAFASGALVNDMLRELEELYAARFGVYDCIVKWIESFYDAA